MRPLPKSLPKPRNYVGCLACYWACPREARAIREVEREPETIMIWVDGVKAEALSGVTVAEALRTLRLRLQRSA